MHSTKKKHSIKCILNTNLENKMIYNIYNVMYYVNNKKYYARFNFYEYIMYVLLMVS